MDLTHDSAIKLLKIYSKGKNNSLRQILTQPQYPEFRIGQNASNQINTENMTYMENVYQINRYKYRNRYILIGINVDTEKMKYVCTQ